MVLAFGGFVITTSVHDSRERSRRRAAALAAQDTTIVGAGLVQGTVRRAIMPRGSVQATPPEELRRRVRNLSRGTYIEDILAEQDSALYRWPDRQGDPMRVYIEPASAVSDWSPSYPQLARDVFSEWSEAGFPLRFTFISDSSSAHIAIRWLDRFPPGEGQRIGVTNRVQSSRFLIVQATLAIANHDSAGRALSTQAVAGIVRHEVGHALGLNHANDATSVMYRQSATYVIGESDRATLRLLYLVPPGSLK